MDSPVDAWGARLYGDPCGTCGYALWGSDVETCVGVVFEMLPMYAELAERWDGSERHPDLGWSVAGYVSHVADNLRIWAERIEGVAAGDDAQVPGYNQDVLSEARQYDDIGIHSALWSLRNAAHCWQSAISCGVALDITLIHERQSSQSTLDIARNNAHDVFHHLWDIRQILAVAGASRPRVTR